jgi:hypothetical protein
MTPARVGIIRYASLATAIERALGAERPPECRIGHARVTITFKRIGATRWPESQQIDFALRAAAIAREILAEDKRRIIRQRVTRAIEIVYEDATLLRGCAVVARWECVVPAS